VGDGWGRDRSKIVLATAHAPNVVNKRTPIPIAQITTFFWGIDFIDGVKLDTLGLWAVALRSLLWTKVAVIL
jgi:hypothetical protein